MRSVKQVSVGDRKDGWIQSCAGRRIFIMDPRPGDFRGHVRELAEMLSKESRYSGGTKDSWYGNAEHSVLVSTWAETLATRKRLPQNQINEIAMHGLFHDATDAYLKDLPRPIKHHPNIYPVWKPIEDRLMAVIYSDFDISPTRQSSAIVKRADREVLIRETEVLMHTPALSQSMLEGYAAAEVEPHPCAWALAMDEFLDRYYELTLRKVA